MLQGPQRQQGLVTTRGLRSGRGSGPPEGPLPLIRTGQPWTGDAANQLSWSFLTPLEANRHPWGLFSPGMRSDSSRRDSGGGPAPRLPPRLGGGALGLVPLRPPHLSGCAGIAWDEQLSHRSASGDFCTPKWSPGSLRALGSTCRGALLLQRLCPPPSPDLLLCCQKREPHSLSGDLQLPPPA